MSDWNVENQLALLRSTNNVTSHVDNRLFIIVAFCLPLQASDRNGTGHLSRELAQIWNRQTERAL